MRVKYNLIATVWQPGRKFQITWIGLFSTAFSVCKKYKQGLKTCLNLNNCFLLKWMECTTTVWWLLSILVLLSLIWFWVNRKRYLLNLRIIYCADRQLPLKSGFAKGSFFKLERPWDLIIFTSEYHFTSNISRGSAAGGIYRNYSRRWKATRSLIVCEFIHQLGKFLF